MKYEFDGYCGVFCGACPVLLATRIVNIPEEQHCYGCKSKNPGGYCTTCGIKACAIRKGFEFCIECAEIDTCNLIQALIADQQYPYGQCVLMNMENIQAMGLPQWMEEESKRWRCENCGEPHSWYQQTCSKCGMVVKNYMEDL